jgi:hypothetical protein
MFSNGSFNFATVTPSLVTFGPPKAFPITLRPFGPELLLLHLLMHQRFNPSRASISNFISFAIIFSLGRRLRQYA